MAAAATMFAACSQTDFVNEAAVVESNASQTIGFEGFAGKSTRAEIKDVTALQGVGFKVWGYKDGAALWTTGEPVTYDGKWGYTNTRYWDKNASYDFYAVAPQDGYASWDGAKFVITEVESGESGGTVKDYLTATREDVTRADQKDDLANTSVNFDFSHVMSKVSVILAKSSDIADDQDLVVTDVKMTGWNDNKGTYNSAGATLAEKWALTDGDAGVATFLTGGTGTVEVDNTDPLGTSFIIVPQSVASLTFTVSYTLGGIVYNNQEATFDVAQVWNPNQHTVYTLTVGPEAIEFGVDEILSWDKVDGANSVN